VPAPQRASAGAAAPSAIDPRVTREDFARLFSLSKKNVDALSDSEWKAAWASEFGSARLEAVEADAQLGTLTATKTDLAHRAALLRDPSLHDALPLRTDHMPAIPADAPADAEWARDDEWATEGSDGLPAPVFGDDPRAVPPAILEELGEPLNMRRPEEEAEEGGAGGGGAASSVRSARHARMTPEEAALDRERRRLREKLVDPVPLPTQPLWPWHSTLLDVSQTANVISGGMVNSTQALVIVGNYHGGVGFGVGKHKEAETAVKFALERAVADAIHVSTYRGQLYHDLVGRKNGVMCILRTRPPAMDGHANWVISQIMSYIGVEHFAGKLVGGKRRNPYTVVQAIFDCFNFYEPYEESAWKRGLRFVHMGADRHSPRSVFPGHSSTPRFLGVRYPNRMNRR
jgi:small subunit ribosomal protein S5